MVTSNRKCCNFHANSSDQSRTVLQIELEVTMQMAESQCKSEIRLRVSGFKGLMKF